LKPKQIVAAITFIIESGVETGFLIKYDAEYLINPELQSNESAPLAIEENQRACGTTPKRSVKGTKRRIVYETDDEDPVESPPKKTKGSKK
jgi:hypothetical protein